MSAIEQLEEAQDYWRAKLSNLTERAHFLPDYERPSTYLDEREQLTVTLPAPVCERLNKLSGNSPFLLYTALHAAMKVCLHKYNGNTHISLGSPSRKNAEANEPANALAIVDEVRSEMSFKQLLMNVRETLLEAYAKQNYPFVRLVRDLKFETVTNRNPLFDVAIALTDIHAPLPMVRNDVTFTFTKESDERITGTVEFNQNLFKRESIERITTHYICVLEQALEDSSRSISALQIVSEEERHQLLVSWNDTRVERASSTVQRLFEEHAAHTPDAIALIFENVRLSYAEVNRHANQLAHRLRALGVTKEVPVAICLERSPELVIGMLAIMKAGGAYLPLDPAYPMERLNYIVRESGVTIALSNTRFAERLPGHEIQVISLDIEAITIAFESEENPGVEVAEDNLAYMIYTSGSTGRPKGVLLQHRGLSNLVHAQAEAFGIDANSRVLQFASASFDASVSEVFVTLAAGATLVLAPQTSQMPGEPLAKLLREQSITVVTLPPSAVAVMPETELPSLQTLVVAGEACPGSIVARWSKGRRFLNAYGPTENTVCASIAVCGNDDGKPSIGKPIANTTIYLLDEQLQPVPVGVPGQLYIGGDALARGYLNRADLTAERFIPHPFSTTAGQRLYNSGDRARYLPDGSIDFLGRLDQQVKIRGFRIEIGEIETVLNEHNGISEAVVIVSQSGNGEQRLVAYVVAAQGTTAEARELRAYMKERVPEYMIPAAFVAIEKMPLTVSGKIDRQALAAIGITEDSAGYEPPRNAIEESLVEIWKQVLGVERVGIHDNFFELGGHSLLAMQLNSRVCQMFQIEIGINSIFSAPTVATLAELIEKEQVGQQIDDTSLEDMLREIESLSMDDLDTALADELNVK
ncbi:MAG TPA: amino acid adenylation domain-containing protein [Pyrinomonadaceae bacterium]